MKIELMSDIHLEFYHNPVKSFLRKLCEPKCDYLILAGDVVTFNNKNLFEILNYFSNNWKTVIWVLGNHEFYGSTVEDVFRAIKLVKLKYKNIKILENDILEIENQRFVCATGWYKEQEKYLKQFISDMQLIEDAEPFIYNQNNITRNWLRDNLRETDICVTHYLPTFAQVAPQYLGHKIDLNGFFVSQFEDVLDKVKPKFWLYGHTHDACRMKMIGNDNTEFICNSAGYPLELEKKERYSSIVLDI